MTKFRQDFEMETNCKNVKTAFNRFAKKYSKAWEIWGEMFEYMNEKGLEHQEEIDKENGGWSLWLYQDEQFNSFYIAIVLTSEEQKI